MRHSGAKRGLASSTFNIDVNPLPVAGQFREFVDQILADGQPAADAGFLADRSLDVSGTR